MIAAGDGNPRDEIEPKSRFTRKQPLLAKLLGITPRRRLPGDAVFPVAVFSGI